jgi:DNA-binding CsgD family transcriptional regulator
MDPKPDGRPITHAEVTRDCSSEVSRAPDRRGIVTSVRFLDPAADPARFVGQPLAVLLRAIGGCDDVEPIANALVHASAAVVEVILSDAMFCLVSSRPLDDASLRVTVRCVDVVLLPDMIAAKTSRMAVTRGLSERERQVLQLLLRGRGVEDIATVLGIAPRTVKFHQANVLQKLGADSRLDLLRVVL